MEHSSRVYLRDECSSTGFGRTVPAMGVAENPTSDKITAAFAKGVLVHPRTHTPMIATLPAGRLVLAAAAVSRGLIVTQWLVCVHFEVDQERAPCAGA